MVCFFSSRRRHTRWPRDWSSDVGSSDLLAAEPIGHLTGPELLAQRGSAPEDAATKQIGRASCRERVENTVVRVSDQKKMKQFRGRRALGLCTPPATDDRSVTSYSRMRSL